LFFLLKGARKTQKIFSAASRAVQILRTSTEIRVCLWANREERAHEESQHC
jgi:hypothetical protein